MPAPSETAAPVVTVPSSGAPDVAGAGEATDFGIDGVTPWVVSNGDFYRIDTALAVPQVPKDSWSLHIHGMVDREITLTFADLLKRPTIERYVTLSCVSNEIGGDLVGNALFQGVRFKDVLDEAGVQPGATQVVSRSIDGWSCGSPTSVIMDGRDAMIAIATNGEPLPPEHGYPVRLVVPGLYGYVSATKWVTEIELARWEDFDGYWVPRGWSKEGPVKTMARIDRPRRKKSYTANADGVIDIAGLAWAVHRGISKVEVSIDGGESVKMRTGRRAERRHLAPMAVPVERRRGLVITTCAVVPTTGPASPSRSNRSQSLPMAPRGTTRCDSRSTEP